MRVKTHRMVTCAIPLSLLAACASLNAPEPTLGSNTVGHAYYWNDGGIHSETAVAAVWTRALDSSSASLLVTATNGRSDTVYLQHTSQAGWTLDAKDSRAPHGWPSVVETSDSVMVGYSDGFVGTTYYLKKLQ